MKDPVILPTSKTSIDRSTIRSHLLSDSTDPFNRAPLKIEEVVPGKPEHVNLLLDINVDCQLDNDLRSRIEAFIAEKKGQRISEVSLMDTSPG